MPRARVLSALVASHHWVSASGNGSGVCWTTAYSDGCGAGAGAGAGAGSGSAVLALALTLARALTLAWLSCAVLMVLGVCVWIWDGTGCTRCGVVWCHDECCGARAPITSKRAQLNRSTLRSTSHGRRHTAVERVWGIIMGVRNGL